jgi:hypothetical protein
MVHRRAHPSVHLVIVNSMVNVQSVQSVMTVRVRTVTVTATVTALVEMIASEIADLVVTMSAMK